LSDTRFEAKGEGIYKGKKSLTPQKDLKNKEEGKERGKNHVGGMG